MLPPIEPGRNRSKEFFRIHESHDLQGSMGPVGGSAAIKFSFTSLQRNLSDSIWESPSGPLPRDCDLDRAFRSPSARYQQGLCKLTTVEIEAI